MNIIIFYIAFFLICFHISGLATTNILRLTRGCTLPVLASKCYCDNCGAVIPLLLQLPIISYVVCKGRCRKCGVKIPKFALALELAVLVGMFVIQLLLDFTVLSITFSFVYYEIIRIIVVIKEGRRKEKFEKQYIVAVIAMLPYYIMTTFVSLLYGVICDN